MEKVYNKLVRDNIPEIIKGNNDGEAVTRILNDDEYKKALEDKLYEEYQEDRYRACVLLKQMVKQGNSFY